MRSGINMIIFGFALLCAASDEGCFCVPCGGANHAPPEMVSGKAIALCCICYSIRKGHKQLADFSGGNWDFRLLLCGCWEKLLHHRRRGKEIAPGGAVTFGLAK